MLHFTGKRIDAHVLADWTMSKPGFWKRNPDCCRGAVLIVLNPGHSVTLTQCHPEAMSPGHNVTWTQCHLHTILPGHNVIET